MSTKKTNGPTFLRFVAPIVETLRELGNSGTPSEVTDRVLERLKVSEQEQEETTSNGQSRVRNQIAWGRFYLAKAGYILTTGSFTSDARKEATRDGVPPIELVDSDKLIGMFERAGLGLRQSRWEIIILPCYFYCSWQRIQQKSASQWVATRSSSPRQWRSARASAFRHSSPPPSNVGFPK